MVPNSVQPPDLAPPLVHLRQDPSGQYTAQVVGLPEIRATAATREQALDLIRLVLTRWLSSGQLVSLVLPYTISPKKAAGWAKGDPVEQQFLEELARSRQEDLERTLREYQAEDQGCSSTSSTPTT
jgi:hypothetical protein